MDNTPGRFALPEKAYYSVVVFLFLLAGAATFFFVRSELRQSKDQLLRSLGSDMRDLLVVYLTDETSEVMFNNPALLGFGIYDEQGSGIYSYLDAPEYLDISKGLEESVWDFDNETVTYVEWTSALFRNRLVGSPDFINNSPILDEDSRHILYIHYDLPPRFYLRRILMIVLAIALLAAFGTATFILRYSYIRYRRLQAEYESKERLIVLGAAARTLTHEMKNPLGVISLQTGLLKRQVPGESPELAIIEEEVGRISSLMDDTRFYLGDDRGDPHEIDLCGFAERMRSRQDPGLEWRVPPGPVMVRMDDDRLRSILENLVTNAVDSGSAVGEIQVVVEAGSDVRILVSDRGCGMDESILKRSQDPFFTTKSRGLGLGLHLVSRFTEAAGGRLGIKSEKDMGTTVTVTLPGVRK